MAKMARSYFIGVYISDYFCKILFLNSSQTLRNEIGFSPIDGLNFSGSVFYSYARQTISEASVHASFNKWGLNLESHILF